MEILRKYRNDPRHAMFSIWSDKRPLTKTILLFKILWNATLLKE